MRTCCDRELAAANTSLVTLQAIVGQPTLARMSGGHARQTSVSSSADSVISSAVSGLLVQAAPARKQGGTAGSGGCSKQPARAAPGAAGAEAAGPSKQASWAGILKAGPGVVVPEAAQAASEPQPHVVSTPPAAVGASVAEVPVAEQPAAAAPVAQQQEALLAHASAAAAAEAAPAAEVSHQQVDHAQQTAPAASGVRGRDSGRTPEPAQQPGARPTAAQAAVTPAGLDPHQPIKLKTRPSSAGSDASRPQHQQRGAPPAAAAEMQAQQQQQPAGQPQQAVGQGVGASQASLGAGTSGGGHQQQHKPSRGRRQQAALLKQQQQQQLAAAQQREPLGAVQGSGFQLPASGQAGPGLFFPMPAYQLPPPQQQPASMAWPALYTQQAGVGQAVRHQPLPQALDSLQAQQGSPHHLSPGFRAGWQPPLWVQQPALHPHHHHHHQPQVQQGVPGVRQSPFGKGPAGRPGGQAPSPAGAAAQGIRKQGPAGQAPSYSLSRTASSTSGDKASAAMLQLQPQGGGFPGLAGGGWGLHSAEQQALGQLQGHGMAGASQQLGGASEDDELLSGVFHKVLSDMPGVRLFTIESELARRDQQVHLYCLVTRPRNNAVSGQQGEWLLRPASLLVVVMKFVVSCAWWCVQHRM